MKAAICYAPQKPLEIAEVDQQGPQAGEVRVRVKATGVCHSDWHVINGDWTLPLPMVLGHEGAGIVEEAPGAYKNVEDVVRIAEGAGLTKIVARMVPLGVVKG